MRPKGQCNTAGHRRKPIASAPFFAAPANTVTPNLRPEHTPGRPEPPPGAQVVHSSAFADLPQTRLHEFLSWHWKADREQALAAQPSACAECSPHAFAVAPANELPCMNVLTGARDPVPISPQTEARRQGTLSAENPGAASAGFRGTSRTLDLWTIPNDRNFEVSCRAHQQRHDRRCGRHHASTDVRLHVPATHGAGAGHVFSERTVADGSLAPIAEAQYLLVRKCDRYPNTHGSGWCGAISRPRKHISASREPGGARGTRFRDSVYLSFSRLDLRKR